MNQAQRKALLALIAGAVCIAFAPIFVRLSQTGPVASGFWRMAIAFVLMSLFMRPRRAEAPLAKPDPTSAPTLWRQGWIFLGVAFFFAGDLATWHISLQYTSVTNSLLIVNSTVFVVALGAWLIYRERPTRALIIGSVIGFLGVAVLILGKNWLGEGDQILGQGAKIGAGESTLLGDLLSMVTNLFYAAYLLQLRYARRWYSASTVLRHSNGICAGLLLIIAITFGETLLPQTLQGWLVIGLLALLCQVLGQTLIARGIEGLPLGFSSMVLLTQPVVGAIASAIVLHESIGITQWMGGALVFAGIYWARPRSK